MKKILVPTDFSQAAEWAVETATNIARKSGGELLLLHVVEKTTTINLIEQNKRQLLDLETGVIAKGIAVKQILKLGNPFHGIASVMDEQNVDLVVMGTSRSSLVGSNIGKVVQHSTCPVLTVHQKPSDN